MSSWRRPTDSLLDIAGRRRVVGHFVGNIRARIVGVCLRRSRRLLFASRTAVLSIVFVNVCKTGRFPPRLKWATIVLPTWFLLGWHIQHALGLRFGQEPFLLRRVCRAIATGGTGGRFVFDHLVVVRGGLCLSALVARMVVMVALRTNPNSNTFLDNFSITRQRFFNTSIKCTIKLTAYCERQIKLSYQLHITI